MSVKYVSVCCSYGTCYSDSRVFFVNNLLLFFAVYVLVGNYYDNLGLMMALDAMQLLDSG